MASLETRIAVLEQAQQDNPQSRTLFVEFVAPDGTHEPINQLRAGNGDTWTRNDGESEQEFQGRAGMEVKRSPWGVALLIAGTNTDGEEHHAQP